MVKQQQGSLKSVLISFWYFVFSGWWQVLFHCGVVWPVCCPCQEVSAHVLYQGLFCRDGTLILSWLSFYFQSKFKFIQIHVNLLWKKLFSLLNHCRTCSWNQPVLCNKDNFLLKETMYCCWWGSNTWQPVGHAAP